MLGTSLTRAVRLANPLRVRAVVWLAGIALGLAVPLLIVLLGLLTELLVKVDGARLEGSGVRLLGPGVVHLIRLGIGPTSQLSWLLTLIVAAGMLALMTAVLVGIHARCAYWTALEVADKLRRLVVEQAIHAGGAAAFAARRDPAEALMHEKCDQIERGLAAWWKTAPSAFVLLATLALVALLVSVSLTICVVSLVALSLLLLRWATSRSQLRRSRCETEAMLARRRASGFLRQLPWALGYSLDGPPTGDPRAQLQQLRRANWLTRTSDTWILPLMLAFGSVAVCFALLLAGINVLRSGQGVYAGGLTVAGVVVLQSCMFVAIIPIVQLSRLGKRLGAAQTSASEVLTYLDKQPQPNQTPLARPVSALQRELAAESLRFADQAGHLLMEDLSLRIPAGKHVAIVATDPQLPLAFAGLVVRFYDPAAGRILWDGVNLRDLQLEGLRRQAVVVPSDGMIFDGSVAENIRCGMSHFTQTEIEEAAKLTRSLGFVQRLPHGFDTPLAGGGRPLTATQVFRLALTRAALRKPSLVIIDEPPLPDNDPEVTLADEALTQLAAGRTMIVLAQRINTLRSAELVLLIHDRKLAAQGPHFQLLQSSSLYRHVNYMRFNEFGTAVR